MAMKTAPSAPVDSTWWRLTPWPFARASAYCPLQHAGADEALAGRAVEGVVVGVANLESVLEAEDSNTH